MDHNNLHQKIGKTRLTRSYRTLRELDNDIFEHMVKYNDQDFSLAHEMIRQTSVIQAISTNMKHIYSIVDNDRKSVL